ncbi:MAG: hypothetical protein KGJ13_06330 [Patescibacteria group bacterium]|nr:hypothetical protein [Patescibacteria group bacterium]
MRALPVVEYSRHSRTGTAKMTAPLRASADLLKIALEEIDRLKIRYVVCYQPGSFPMYWNGTFFGRDIDKAERYNSLELAFFTIDELTTPAQNGLYVVAI